MKYIITKYKINNIYRLFEAVLDDNDKAVELFLNPKEDGVNVGNIYIAKAEKIIKNSSSCFLNIGKSKIFLNIPKNQKILYSNKFSKGKEIKEGDFIVAEIKNAGIKGKNPTATVNFNIKSEHIILIFGEKGIHFSKNIPNDMKDKILFITNKIIEDDFKDYKVKEEIPSIIFRSNINNIPLNYDIIKTEFKNLLNEYFTFINKAVHSSPFSLVRKSDYHFIDRIMHIKEPIDEIITDIPEVYDILLKHTYINSKKITMYEYDFSLHKLYSLERALYNATKSDVNLKSGANIKIEQTEAFNVIDINSSHSSKLKASNKDEFLYKINIEAAKEIARQIRLRNLSGIIIVDFINMKDDTLLDSVMDKLKNYVKNDYVKVKVIDKTKLSLVEIIREKKYSSLKEQLTSGK